MQRLTTLAVILALAWPAAGVAGDVTFKRSYVDGAHGQVHVLTARPSTGEASGIAMICLAPNPMAGRYFRLFMEELASDRVVIAPDYPGLGQSDAPAQLPDMAGYADAMAGVLDALGYGDDGLGRVDVCGYHTGAMVAVELAVRRPELVNRLVLAGIPFFEGEERERMYRENVVANALEDDFDSLRGSWQFAVSDREDGVSLERAYGNFVDLLRQRPIMHYAYHAVFSYAAEEQAPKVVQPVLVLNTHGGLEKETRALAPYFREVTLVEIPELRHGVFDVGATILARHIRDWKP